MADAPHDDLANYLEMLRARLASLENELHRAIAEEQQREERLVMVRNELHVAIAGLGADIQTMEDALGETVRQTRSLVHSFRDSARTQEFSRLQQRVEAWGGERFISRDEFKRLLRGA